MKLLKGKIIADKILKRISCGIKKEKIKPGLAVILVGKDKASEIYVKIKKKTAQENGLLFYLFNFSSKVHEKEIINLIQKLNADKKINGIVVQMPLPKRINTKKILAAIVSQKNVDKGVFPQAIMEILKSAKIDLCGKKAVVFGNSTYFGKTMLSLLEKCGIKSNFYSKGETGIIKNIKKLKKADIIITALGKPNFINGKMIKNGAIVIDGGIVKKGKKIVGDVNRESMEKKNIFLSPVPGGVGPVTVACLLRNTYRFFKKSL